MNDILQVPRNKYQSSQNKKKTKRKQKKTKRKQKKEKATPTELDHGLRFIFYQRINYIGMWPHILLQVPQHIM
jgi:hypothetical protein